MSEYTFYTAAIGGGIIGLAAVVLLLFKGKVAGVSGIVNRSFTVNREEFSWRIVFILGLILGPVIAAMFGSQLPTHIDLEWPTIIIGGFLVGFGSNLGNGCTSGHGICGVGRFSPRSLVATLTFMTVAISTYYFMNHFLGGH